MMLGTNYSLQTVLQVTFGISLPLLTVPKQTISLHKSLI